MLKKLRWPVLWQSITRFKTKTRNDVLFIIGNWNAKVGSQEVPGVAGKFDHGVKNEVGQRLTEFCQKKMLTLTLTIFQQPKRLFCTCASSDDQHWNKIDYILYSQRWRSSIQLAKIKPGADCGSDHELLIAKFKLKLKKVGKTTRPFRYELNQMPYDYTVELMNRFKGLNLVECLKNYGQKAITLYKRQWLKTPKDKEMQEGKVIFWGDFTNSWRKKEKQRQVRKGKINPTESRVPENSKEI